MLAESVVLAAGHGTRMRSASPKVLHALGGRPLLDWASRAAEDAVGRPPILIVGPEVEAALPPGARFAVQRERLGTGHALLQARPAVDPRAEVILVTSADMPLLQGSTLRRLLEEHRRARAPLTLVRVSAAEARGFGRIRRDPQGRIAAIVEEADASDEERRIGELNVGVYAFQPDGLWERLSRLPRSAKGEFYLTDIVRMIVKEGLAVGEMDLHDPEEAIGVNTRRHLAEAEAALRRRTNERWMQAGVTLRDPATAYIGPEVVLESDVVIEANTHLEGATVVGIGSHLGPNTILRDARVGRRCRVFASVVEQAELEDEVEVGPFSHLRPGARIGRGSHLGNFAEVKNSRLAAGVRMGHFSYVGDAEVGESANIGAGTITCNFDGERKHPTHIGAGAFIGSDTMLVAPVRVGAGARTGAGSVVTRNVPDHSVAVGVPARVIRRKEPPDG